MEGATVFTHYAVCNNDDDDDDVCVGTLPITCTACCNCTGIALIWRKVATLREYE